ncbi:hypothetical protein RhiirA1_453161 [Rhizophagus irregularis]|uniref:Uncharacterized protein n=1 Tax=Rhizophagus irregularis TaxID=588596 RepID=A0A2I1E1W8_9GLOM|nr:hypothetical protein RhiirA1_453161 [Rhizophagus irregularis]PKY16079.1 hypothetical protein RhiirB3_428403 [Rhizophagus irregularis]
MPLSQLSQREKFYIDALMVLGTRKEKKKDAKSQTIRYFSGISSYSSNTEIEAWGYIGCLEYLAKVGVHLTLEDRDDILGRYRNHLHSIFSSTLTLKKAKDKAYKLNYAAERSFKRVEVTSFFKKLDTLRTAIWNGYFGFFKKPPFSKELIRTLIAVSRISLRII